MGDARRAEAEWSQLCNRVAPSPPTLPRNPIAALVKGASEQMIGIEAMTSSKACEDFETGLPRSCDNVGGVPGLGSEDSPCVIFTPTEVQLRLWPAMAVD